MRLSKIAALNMMGGTFTLELGALNIVHGTNDSGKTRLGNLIKLLLLGYLPTLDKKPGDIFRLSSGAAMEMSGVFDDGVTTLYRSWKQSGESVRTAAHVPKEFDNATPLVLLDANDYFGRTARGRVEMVFSVAKIKEHDVTFPDQIARIIRQAAPQLTVINLGDDGVSEFKIQEFIESALTAVEEARKTAAADVRRFTGTLQGLTTLQLDDKPATRSIEEIDAEIQTEQRAAAEKQAQRKGQEEAKQADERLELERDHLRHKIEQAGDPPQRDFDSTALREREGYLVRSVSLIQLRQHERDEWQRREDVIRSGVKALTKEIEELKLLGTGVSSIATDIATITARIAKQKTVTCSKCKQKIAAKPVKDADKLPALQAKLQQHQSRAEEVKRKREQITKLTATSQSAPELLSDNKDILEAELKQVRDDIAEFVQTVEVVAWRKQLAEIPETKDRTAEIATLTAEAQAHEDRVRTLQTERKAAESDRQDRKRLAEAREAQEKAVADEIRFKAAKKFLLEKKSELIEAVFGPLLETAGRFMHGIFTEPVEYRDGELGIFKGNSWVTEEVFGGAKRKLLHGALKCALGAQSPCKIILMDELLNMVTHLEQFMKNVRDAQKAEIIEQFIGFIPTGELFPGDRIPRVKDFTFIEAHDNTYTTI